MTLRLLTNSELAAITCIIFGAVVFFRGWGKSTALIVFGAIVFSSFFVAGRLSNPDGAALGLRVEQRLFYCRAYIWKLFLF